MAGESKDKYDPIKQAGLLTAIPFLLAVAPIIGYLIGNYLDRRLGTSPYLMILFIVLGFIAGGKEVYDIIVRLSPEDKERRGGKT